MMCLYVCVCTSRIDVLCESFCTTGFRSRPTTVVLPLPQDVALVYTQINKKLNVINNVWFLFMLGCFSLP